MKNLFWIVPLLVFAAVGSAACGSTPDYEYSAVVDASHGSEPKELGAELDIGYCYNYLSAYGTWVSFRPYGYVWRPRHMGYRWRPYSEGHWVWTDFGWTWIDDAEWGWVPFHYGRWGWDDDLGWYWVPGTVWGPAWVAWRTSDMYLGWAPVPPGIEFHAGMDFAAVSIRIPFTAWIFVGGSHFLDRDIHPYVIPYERNVTIVNHSTFENHYSFRGDRFINDGIGVDAVRRITRHDVPEYRLQDSRQPGSARIEGNAVRLYRPSFRASPEAHPKAALDRAQAGRELAPAKVYEPRHQPPAHAPESAVRQRQAEERALVQETQSEELKNIQRRAAEEAKRAQTASDRAKIQQDYRTRASELQKQHEAERQQLNERHKNDTERVKQATQAKPAKQQAPPPKKKK